MIKIICDNNLLIMRCLSVLLSECAGRVTAASARQHQHVSNLCAVFFGRDKNRVGCMGNELNPKVPPEKVGWDISSGDGCRRGGMSQRRRLSGRPPFAGSRRMCVASEGVKCMSCSRSECSLFYSCYFFQGRGVCRMYAGVRERDYRYDE